MARKVIGILVVIAILMISSLTVYADPNDQSGAVSTQDASTVSTSDTGDKTVPDAGDKVTPDTGDKVVPGDKPENGTGSDYKDLLDSLIKDGNAKESDQFLVTIRKPETDKISVSKKSYIITGTTEETDVKMFMAKLNEKTGEYEAFENTDGESSWEIGSFGMFAKEIVLTKGFNKIKMVAYRTSQEKGLKIEDVQVKYFTISLLDENIFKKVFDFINYNIFNTKPK